MSKELDYDKRDAELFLKITQLKTFLLKVGYDVVSLKLKKYDIADKEFNFMENICGCIVEVSSSE